MEKDTNHNYPTIENHPGHVLWITGLSGSGKSTLSKRIAEKFQLSGKPIIRLDGDQLRDIFGSVSLEKKSFNKNSRIELAFRYARLCRVLSLQGFDVVISTISLFKDVHKWNRENIPGYIEIYLDVPVSELQKRDPKGIYQRFREGEIQHVAGLDLPVDEPANPDIHLKWKPGDRAEDYAQIIFQHDALKGFISKNKS